MDKLKLYRDIIQKVLTEYQEWAAGAKEPGIQQCLSFDVERDHYFWFHVGWQGKDRDFGVM
ncbi:XisI protein, partial [filamentous cyanobacterium CCP5]